MRTMRFTATTFRSVFVAFLMIGATNISSTAFAETGYAIVKKIQGTARYTGSIGEIALRVGQQLSVGQRITTDKDSYVDLDLGINGDALRIEAESSVTFTELTFRKLRRETVVRTDLNVTKGVVVANVVKKLSRSSRYRIKSPAGAAGIRGTCVQVGVAGVVTVTGSVQFTSVNGRVQMVLGGFAFNAGGNAAQRAGTARTQSIAASATASTTNIGNPQMLQATVQQFVQAIASQAAVTAANTDQATTTATQTAAAAIQALTDAVQQEAATAPAEIRAQVQQAVQAVQSQAASITVTAAAAAAATATVAIATREGATPQQAEAQAQEAATKAATQAGEIAVEKARQDTTNPNAARNAAQQVDSVKQQVSTVASDTIKATQTSLASGGNADQAINTAAESTPTVTVSSSGQAVITPSPTAPGTTSSSALTGFVEQVSKLSGQTQGQTVGTLAQIVADPFLAPGVVEAVQASQQPGGLAQASQVGGGLSATATTVLKTLGVSSVGGLAAQTTIQNSGGTAGTIAATDPSGSTQPPSSP